MIVNYSELKEQINTYIDEVTSNQRKRCNKQKEFQSKDKDSHLNDSAYLLSNKANYDWLMNSIKQYEKGQVTQHNLI